MMHFATDDEWNELADQAPVICMEIWLTLYGEEHDQELQDLLESRVDALREDNDQLEFDWEGYDTDD